MVGYEDYWKPGNACPCRANECSVMSNTSVLYAGIAVEPVVPYARAYGMQTSHLSPTCMFITVVAKPSPKVLTRYENGIMVLGLYSPYHEAENWYPRLS